LTTAVIKLPEKLIPVFTPPRGSVRYRGAYGGRGSAKSMSFAKMAAVWGYAEPLRILCTRELQASIKNSFHAELKNAIASEPWLAAWYDVGIDYLRGPNGTEFIFAGLRHNIGSIKSTAQIDLCIVEEGEDVPESSWVDLEPTIRAPGSEIWVIWNPRKDGSPIDTRFIKRRPDDALIVEMNWRDNPKFPKVLNDLRLRNKAEMDDGTYQHIWEGGYLKRSKAHILAHKLVVKSFTPAPGWEGPYHGLDFGFSHDPTAAVRCWVFDNRLYVEYESGGVGIELDHTVATVGPEIPNIAAHVIRADSARPESISYLKRHGWPRVEACKKWPGSVEDGIAHLLTYSEIVVHERCTEVAKECRTYAYKVDRLTGDVLPVIVDANNHYIDAIRYALGPLIRTPLLEVFE
jgi:phage terminase large subunit